MPLDNRYRNYTTELHKFLVRNWIKYQLIFEIGIWHS